MKTYIVTLNGMNLVTNITDTHYVCGSLLFIKSDVNVKKYVLDDVEYPYLHEVPFVNF